MNSISVEEAYRLLLEAKKLNDGKWIEHSLRVGEAAERIAKALNLDSNRAKVLGYIHDIGKRFSMSSNHLIDGYNYISELGYEDYASICLTHSYLNNDIDCQAGGILSNNMEGHYFLKNYIINHRYTIYDKIINLCDLLCSNQFLTLDERLIDLIKRKGVHENTVYHITEAHKLKEYFDNKLGKNVYSLFPELIERLK